MFSTKSGILNLLPGAGAYPIFERVSEPIFFILVLSDCSQSEDLLIQKKVCSEYFQKLEFWSTRAASLRSVDFLKSTQNKVFFV